jgi:hypothetical protein
MKSLLEKLSVLTFLFLLVACKGGAALTAPETSIPSTPTEIVTVPDTSTETGDTTVVVASPSPSPTASPEAQVDLSQYKQKFIQHAELMFPNWNNFADEDKAKIFKHIAHAWLATMHDQDPTTMEYNAENVNRFFQFVRLAAGKDFFEALKKTAQLNESAHALFKVALVEKNSALLGQFESHLVELAQPSMKFKSHILAVAGIYGVKLEDAPIHPAVVKAHVDAVVSLIETAFNVQVQDNYPVPVRLTELYGWTTLGVQGGTDQFTFLPLLLVPDGFSSADGVKRFQVEHNLYGAVFLKNSPFIQDNSN